MYQAAKHILSSARELNQSVQDSSAPALVAPSEICWAQGTVGLGTLDSNFGIACGNEAFFQLLQIASPLATGENLLTIAGFKPKAIEHISAIVDARQHWKGMVRNDKLAIRIEINAIANPETTSDRPGKHPGFSVILIDYTDDYLQYQNLSAARIQAEKTDKAKSQFLSHMSHELRTPLNAILGFAQLMGLSENLDEVEQDNLREIESAGQYLLSLINEILDLSKIESGKLKLTEENFALDILFEECLALVGSMAKMRPVKLQLNLSEKLHITTDHVRFKQVVINLLSNAIKYNEPNGEVLLSAHKTAHQTLKIEIQDSGRGIASEKLPYIFSPFERLGADDRNIEGTGIGLMITRRLVKLMQGDIGVFSEPERGSVFWLEFPLTPGMEVTEEAENAGAFTHVPNERPIRISWFGTSDPLYALLERVKILRPSMVIYQYDLPMPDHPLFPLPDILFLTPEIIKSMEDQPRLFESLKHTVVVAVNDKDKPVQFPDSLRQRGVILPFDCKLTTLLALLDNNRHEHI